MSESQEPGEKHLYRVPITGYGSAVVSAESVDEAMEITRDEGYRVDLEINVDPSNRGQIERSEDEPELSDPINERPPDIPSIPSIQRLSGIRKELGISQADISEQTGIDRSTISKWERGKHGITAYNLERYRDALYRLRGAKTGNY